ncbi:MAG: branched-chain-amino-acid transaminase [Nitrospirae bacterium]|nr:branched-chain-amino-acid transaminase [Nitrospirota bacterium]
MLVYLDGHFVAGEKAQISVFDHGFLYGDGIYETMRAYEGKLFLLRKHLGRLKLSADAISLKLPLPLDKIGDALNESLSINKLQDAYVRLHISRGPGEIGLDPALCVAPTMVIVAKPFHDYPAACYERGVSVAIVTTRRNHPLALPPSIKGTNFLNNILAKIEAVKARAYEGIMLNWEGYVAEGTISNIFMVRKGVLYTPHLDTGILKGVTRELVLRLAKRIKIPVKEAMLRPKDLVTSSECFITNTTMEIMPVTTIDRKKIGKGIPGPITADLHRVYQKEVRAWLKAQAV